MELPVIFLWLIGALIAVTWLIFPFLVVGRLNRIIAAMEEIKEAAVWQKETAEAAKAQVIEMPGDGPTELGDHT